jgi:peptidoglycan/xylan/chitin deacetylase (PgdA/CDA1 family)
MRFMPAAAMTAIVIAASLLTSPARASRCPGNPGALGTSRVLTVDAREYSRVGKMQYSQSTQLPLKDREVVLTFDDGPLPPYTESVLKALAAECVKATFFSVGRQARQFPALLRRAFNEGHTIATHSQNHPLTFDQMSPERAQREIDDGIASVTAALGDPRAVAPFFRIPGLLRVTAVEDYLAGKGIAVWSVDADADDWYKTATPETVVQKAMSRLNQRGRGILLLHDVQPATALALPALLRELKANGYRVVHVVPTGRRPHLRGSHVAADTPRASSGRKKAKPRRPAVTYHRTYYYYSETPMRTDPWPYIRW